jgi:GntR family transcriptional regulator, vanillate catabolism transcriptional regulator
MHLLHPAFFSLRIVSSEEEAHQPGQFRSIFVAVYPGLITYIPHPIFMITVEHMGAVRHRATTHISAAPWALARQGVLEARPGGGYLAPSSTDEELHHIIAVRMLLEPAVRMAAEEYDEVHIERISKAIKAEVAAANNSDPSGFARANREFRHAVFDGLASKALSNLIKQFDNHLQFICAVTLRDTALRKEVVVRQSKICDALQKHDGERAQTLWRAYLKYTEDALTDALSQLHGAANVALDRRIIGTRAHAG